MRSLPRLVALAVALLALAATTASAAPPAKIRNPDVTAAGLINEYLTLVQNKDQAGLDRFLAPGFQIQRADGTHANKAEYLANLPTVSQQQVANIVATLDGPVLVARYEVSSLQIVNGVQYGTDYAPRLSVFEYNGKARWQLVAHSNFNAPGRT
jgi:hypothetical protein